MRIPSDVHRSRGWLIDEIAPDFRLLDAWALPATGAAEDFPRLVELMSSLGPTGVGSRPARLLFDIRLRLGRLLGWDDEARPAGAGGAGTLRSRLPQELRGTAGGPSSGSFGFVPLFLTEEEAASEISNRTVHGVLQLAWVERADGSYQGRMAIYVKPRGLLGEGYMAAIGPFRHHIVYPALMREIERRWSAPSSGAGQRPRR